MAVTEMYIPTCMLSFYRNTRFYIYILLPSSLFSIPLHLVRLQDPFKIPPHTLQILQFSDVTYMLIRPYNNQTTHFPIDSKGFVDVMSTFVVSGEYLVVIVAFAGTPWVQDIWEV
ncbi:hypothetical protein KCU73_g8221, partial [Aureobasidium melanogenum]